MESLCAPQRASIGSLPDELVLKIIALAARRNQYKTKTQYYRCDCDRYKRKIRGYENHGTCKYKHGLIVKVISRISARFNRLARHPTLWKDEGSWIMLCSIPVLDVPQAATIDSLPDEITLMIIELAAIHRHGSTYLDYSFIVGSLSMISKRFNRLCRDPTLWQEEVAGHLLTLIPILDVAPPASFTSLPDELIVKIIKMVGMPPTPVSDWREVHHDRWDVHQFDYPTGDDVSYIAEDKVSRPEDFLKISPKFRRIVANSDLFEGNVVMDWKDTIGDDIINEFLGTATKCLELRGSFKEFSEGNMMALSHRCSNLKTLSLSNIKVAFESWPTFCWFGFLPWITL